MDQYYDTIAPGYEELYREEQLKKLEVISNNISISGGDKLLDVGCGTGLVQEFFEKKFGIETFGVDPSEQLLKRNPYQCAISSAEDMSFDDEEYDIVVALTVVQNFDDIENGLKNIKRVGKKRFILTYLKKSPKAEMMESKIDEIFGKNKKVEEDKDMIHIVGF